MSFDIGASLAAHTPETRKRKRDDTKAIQLDSRPFSIRADSIDPFASPRTLTPVCLLPRAYLPLAYLDTTSLGAGLFSANLAVLEAEDERNVLIAEEVKQHTLYAIERVQKKKYALCRLGSWVRREELLTKANVRTDDGERQTKRRAVQSIQSGQPWWSRAAVESNTARHLPTSENLEVPELAMRIHEHSGHGDERHVVVSECADTTSREQTGASVVEGPQDEVEAPPAPLSPADHLQELAKQYLDTLYLSRTSLAYFAKGPISRARSAFVGQGETGCQATDLIAFLRATLLTSATMDTKYREGISAILRDIPVLESPVKVVKSRKRRRWKAKRDKAGFFVNEKDFVKQWWHLREDSNALDSTETIEKTLTRRLPYLRSRETYLHIIITLEILALEASLPPDAGPAATKAVNALEDETQDLRVEPLVEGKKRKEKKVQDLSKLLETLVDRLCIWHSIESTSPAKRHGKLGDSDEVGANDELKSFCVEIIIPFYMSRIPQHAAAINKKLGGPSAPTPVKSKSSAARKPGKPAVRQPPEKKPRESLARVSTDTLKRTMKNAPVLHRSATNTNIKRESSEVAMETSAARMPLQPRKRTSLVHSISFSKREVDLSAMSQVNEAKLRKKAEVEEKLREAITTLKKPNRALAVKEVADRADESFARVLGKARPPNSQHRAKTVAQSVVVEATPKHVKATRHHPAAQSGGGHSRSSDISIVPSSSSKLMPHPPDQAAQSTPAVPQTGHRPRHPTNVMDTPSRGFARYMPPGLAHQPGTLESPVANRRMPSVPQTPSKSTRSLSLTIPSPAPLLAASPNLIKIAAVDGMNKGRTEELRSVYDALGWNDEYEELA